MNIEQINKIIEMLEAFRKYPIMYTGSINVDLTITFLHGFHSALSILHSTRLGPLNCTVQEERGWSVNALGPFAQMRERGMTPEAIIDELLVIEIETWKRAAKDLAKQRQPGLEVK